MCMYPVAHGCSSRRVYGEGCTQGGAAWVGAGGWYTGILPNHPPAARYIGIARAQPMPGPAFLRPRQALQAPAGPSAHLTLPALNMPSWDQYGRDSAVYILKLVIILECRLKSVMRPGIVPVSETGSNITTLNFQVFHIREPSLTRNKWSCL